MLKSYFRNIMNTGLNYVTKILLWLRLKVQRWFGLVSCYQSNPFKITASNDPRVRVCEERYIAFSQFLPKHESLSIIDIGCNQGYFLFRMANSAALCVGIEKAYNEVMYARSLAATHNIKNVIFMDYAIT